MEMLEKQKALIAQGLSLRRVVLATLVWRNSLADKITAAFPCATPG